MDIREILLAGVPRQCEMLECAVCFGSGTPAWEFDFEVKTEAQAITLVRARFPRAHIAPWVMEADNKLYVETPFWKDGAAVVRDDLAGVPPDDMATKAGAILWNFRPIIDHK